MAADHAALIHALFDAALSGDVAEDGTPGPEAQAAMEALVKQAHAPEDDSAGEEEDAVDHFADADHWAEAAAFAAASASASRKVGETWKGPSGRHFTKRQDGRVVPAKNPDARAPEKKAPAEKKPAAAAGGAKKTAPAEGKPTVDSLHAEIQEARAKGLTPEAVKVLGKRLGDHLTVVQLTDLKKRLGLAASGAKAVLAQKIAERALAGAKAVSAPTPAAAPEPAQATKAPAADTGSHEDRALSAVGRVFAKEGLADGQGTVLARDVVRDLLASGMSKPEIDAALHKLATDDVIYVNPHNQPSFLTPQERAELPDFGIKTGGFHRGQPFLITTIGVRDDPQSMAKLRQAIAGAGTPPKVPLAAPKKAPAQGKAKALPVPAAPASAPAALPATPKVEWTYLADSEGRTTANVEKLLPGKNLDRIADAVGGGTELLLGAGGGYQSLSVFDKNRKRLLTIQRHDEGEPVTAMLAEGEVKDLTPAQLAAMHDLGIVSVHDFGSDVRKTASASTPKPAPAPAAVQPDHVAHLTAAIQKHDRGVNLAHLADVRDELATRGITDRAHQDVVIKHAMRQGKVVGAGAEGRHGVTERERAAYLPGQAGEHDIGHLMLR